MTTHQIGSRIRALREERNLSQDSLARLFGFKDRQTISAIETGLRRVTAEELLLAVEKLDAPLEYFTGSFSAGWRRALFMAAIGRRRQSNSQPMKTMRGAGSPRSGRWLPKLGVIPRFCVEHSASTATRVSRMRCRPANGSSVNSNWVRFRHCAWPMSWKENLAFWSSWSMYRTVFQAQPAVCRNWTRC